MKITYAGHSAILCELAGKIVAIDPWLDGNPSCPKELINPEKIDAIVLTHGHSDHASDTPRLFKQYQPDIFCVFELGNILASEGVSANKIHGMNTGGCIDFNGIQICFTHAQHSSSYDTKDGTLYAGVACGAVLKTPDFCLYHAGDTALFSDMKLIGENYKPDIACLPIGDVFTMCPEQAAVAAHWIRPRVAIPVHYNTFPFLTGTAEKFQQACSELDIESIALKPGSSQQF